MATTTTTTTNAIDLNDGAINAAAQRAETWLVTARECHRMLGRVLERIERRGDEHGQPFRGDIELAEAYAERIARALMMAHRDGV